VEGDLFYLIYLASYKFFIIIAGCFSIYLGYRLFSISKDFAKSNSQMDIALLDSIKIKMTHVLPGTVFMVFGIFLISLTILKNPAEIDLLSSYKNDSESYLNQRTAKGKNDNLYSCPLKTRNDTINYYESRIDSIVYIANNLAYLLYLQNSNLDKAEFYANFATKICPDDPKFQFVLASIYHKNGKIDEALKLFNRLEKTYPEIYIKLKSTFK
jgi:tetratricopeptide (TPR) repeat protein